MSAAETEPASLDDELFQVELQTEDGDPRAKIVDIDDSDTRITVATEIQTTGETFEETFEKPDAWNHEYKFVRLVEYCGYNAATSSKIVDCEVPVKKYSDEWQLNFDRLPFEPVWDGDEYSSGVYRGVIVTTAIVIYLRATWYISTTAIPIVSDSLGLLLFFVVFGIPGAIAGIYYILSPILRRDDRIINPITPTRRQR